MVKGSPSQLVSVGGNSTCKIFQVGNISGASVVEAERDGRGVVQDRVRAVGGGQNIQCLQHHGNDLGLQP